MKRTVKAMVRDIEWYIGIGSREIFGFFEIGQDVCVAPSRIIQMVCPSFEVDSISSGVNQSVYQGTSADTFASGN